MGNHVAVGLADVRVTAEPDDILVAYSLGSCIGLALWDPETKTGGMAHIVLPSSGGFALSGPNSHSGVGTSQVEVQMPAPGKYADTAVPYLCRVMEAAGCNLKRVRASIAGGAHVLKDLSWPQGDIGAANAKAVQAALQALGMKIQKSDTGENYGRTMRLYVSNGRVTVSSVGRAERDI